MGLSDSCKLPLVAGKAIITFEHDNDYVTCCKGAGDRLDHVTRNELAAWNIEAKGLGKEKQRLEWKLCREGWIYHSIFLLCFDWCRVNNVTAKIYQRRDNGLLMRNKGRVVRISHVFTWICSCVQDVTNKHTKGICIMFRCRECFLHAQFGPIFSETFSPGNEWTRFTGQLFVCLRHQE